MSRSRSRRSENAKRKVYTPGESDTSGRLLGAKRKRSPKKGSSPSPSKKRPDTKRRLSAPNKQSTPAQRAKSTNQAQKNRPAKAKKSSRTATSAGTASKKKASKGKVRKTAKAKTASPDRTCSQAKQTGRPFCIAHKTSSRSSGKKARKGDAVDSGRLITSCHICGFTCHIGCIAPLVISSDGNGYIGCPNCFTSVAAANAASIEKEACAQSNRMEKRITTLSISSIDTNGGIVEMSPRVHEDLQDIAAIIDGEHGYLTRDLAKSVLNRCLRVLQ